MTESFKEIPNKGKHLESKERLHYSLEFLIDPEMDMQFAQAFRRTDWAIFRHYPELEKYFEKSKNGKFTIVEKEAVKNAIDNFYAENKENIKEELKTSKIEWAKKEEKFNELVKNLFEDATILSGKYYAFSTMWMMYPRFIDGGYFGIPAIKRNDKDSSMIIAHEMLHFAFYKYLYEKYPESKSKESSDKVWHVSEIFNAVLQSTDDWVNVFGGKQRPYPEHTKIYEKLLPKYEHQKDIKADELIEDIKKELEHSN